jgi:dipeptidyl aminopeptidase/acylaminoacyl peptidase
MRKFLLLLLLCPAAAFAQNRLEKLTVEKIMRDPKWMGSSPSALSWGYNSKYLYFNWNPEGTVSDSVYYITTEHAFPRKTTWTERQSMLTANDIVYNSNRTHFVYAKEGDIFLKEVKSGTTKRITQTAERESNPQFSFNDTRVVYSRGQDLFAWDIAGGLTIQLTNFQQSGSGAVTASTASPQRGARQRETIKENLGTEEKWLKADQLNNFEVLKSRKAKRDLTDSMTNRLPKENPLRVISLQDKNLAGTTISPDGRFITYRLYKPAQGKNTIVPDYVTESGYTEDIAGRTKVGAPQGSLELFVFDTKADTVILVKTDSIPGSRDLPAYLKDYPNAWAEESRKPVTRAVNCQNPSWSPGGRHVVVDIRAQDHKDRWLMLLNPTTGRLSLLDRQHDDAWIAGPGIGGSYGGGRYGWIDDNTFWFQSEATGYSHLYTINVATGEKKALTSGNDEVQDAIFSAGKKYFYIATNEVHPGEQQFYRLPITGGRPERITTLTGASQVSLSPDEKYIAFLYSYTNRPWELYLQENRPGSMPKQVTDKAMSDEFKSYPWRDPELVSFTARDGAKVYARLYRPVHPGPSKPGVIFVHGAGYLQNAHKWWSSYFREYMFNNLLADNGYTVMDIDYRGSAGYGRNWRTGIYRHMGGKDLDDQVDAAIYMTRELGVEARHIGLYGGSYGGFLTLMGLFTRPDIFAAGAALRPVTDWANYNHGYTSDILNEPFNDSIAYKQSSPYYFANGLKGHLLICHGMVDTNVNFQDAVKLAQRLIELGKDNWELAPYPMEDHGFVEPGSWTDEYKRILKLFETTLK